VSLSTPELDNWLEVLASTNSIVKFHGELDCCFITDRRSHAYNNIDVLRDCIRLDFGREKPVPDVVQSDIGSLGDLRVLDGLTGFLFDLRDRLEDHLLGAKQFCHRFTPGYAGGQLHEAANGAALHNGDAFPAGKKLLLVLAQFEQWLVANRGAPAGRSPPPS
jgi:hypothetical protein